MRTKIKHDALKKLNKCVEAELKYLRDTNSSLDCIKLECEHLFSEEELREIRNCIKQINGGDIINYCHIHSITIPQELI